MNWKLTDTERWAESHPNTFEIPPVEERTALHVGDVAKVIFESKASEVMSERMWIVVTEVHEPGKYTGEVDSHAMCNPELPRLGDLIQFEAKHIMQMIRMT